MKKIFLIASLFISSYTFAEANEDKMKEIIDALDATSKISAEDKKWLDRNDANIISLHKK